MALFDWLKKKAAEVAAGPVSTPSERYSLTVNYRNHQGVEKTFHGDPSTLRGKRKHLSMCLSPSGQRVVFSRARILNLSDVEAHLKSEGEPTPRERQVLSYHQLHGSTSPLYEQIRQKYPNWTRGKGR